MIIDLQTPFKFIYMVKKLFLILFIVFSNAALFSQTEKQIDSLFQVTKTTKNDSVKIKALNKIGFYYIFNDALKAKNILNDAEKISLQKKQNYGLAETTNIKGILMDVSGKSDSAFYYFKKAFYLGIKGHFKNIQVRSLNNIGMYHYNKGNSNAALSCFFKTLKINETLPVSDQIKTSICYNNIGLIYQELNLNAKALSFHQKAYALRVKDNLVKDQASSLNNIGICYTSLHKLQLAILTYKKGIQIAIDSKDDVNFYKMQENMGNALQLEGKFKESISYYEKGLKNENKTARNEIQNYTGLIAAYNELNAPLKALAYVKDAVLILKKNPDLKFFSSDFYQYTSQTYYVLGNKKLGELYNRIFIEIVKSNFSEKNAKQIASYEIKYQTAKKEKLLLQKEAEAKKRNQLILGLVILSFFVGLIGFLIYRQQKLKNKQQNQAFELKQAINQIETQNKLQSQRLAISKDLHDNIGAQLTFIISSVETAKFAPEIENTKLGNKLTKISDFTKDTIVELRDTIWAMNSNEITYEELQSRISNFIEKANDATENTVFKFDIDAGLEDTKLSSIDGMNIYRTIQEALNNALKYANASEISIAIKKIENQITIDITDNGKGFDKEKIVNGNGLSNMKKRIEEIGGVFELISELNKGTAIKITL